MLKLEIQEHSQLMRSASGASVSRTNGKTSVPAHLYDRLKRFDQLNHTEADRVFDWRDGTARARQWVGVIQGRKTGQQVGVRFVNLHQDLTGREGQARLQRQLSQLLAESADCPAPPPGPPSWQP